MKKNDVILIGIIIVAACLLFFGSNFIFGNKQGDYAVIKIEGKEVKRLSLNENTIYEIPLEDGHKNIVEIKDGKADMIDADCPDLKCVYQKKISKQGETIICLPHKVVVEIISKEKSQLDAVAN